MALSRTARILIAVLLLAAAAFFWINFFQDRMGQAQTDQPGVASTSVPLSNEAGQEAAQPQADDGTPEVSAEADPDAAPADGTEQVAVDGDDGAAAQAADAADDAQEAAEAAGEAQADPAPSASAEPAADADPSAPTEASAQDQADTADAAAEPDPAAAESPVAIVPPVVVLDTPTAVSRDIVVADLPFLITSPLLPSSGTEEQADADQAPELRVGVVAERVISNPFSPVVMRTVEAPVRDVPMDAVISEVPMVVDVPVPGQPGAAPGLAAVGEPGAVVSVPTTNTVGGVTVAAPPRANTPTPSAVAPTTNPSGELQRPLPSGGVLVSTPDLLRQTRTAPAEPTTPAVDFAEVAAIAEPEAEAVQIETADLGEAASAMDEQVLEPLAAGAVRSTIAGSNGEIPLAAGVNRLARYLRDNDYSFTGSVTGPVGIGLFRSLEHNAPMIVALGQKLPDTDIVLTDLRGQQAELTLDDIKQILTLDIRR